MTAIFAELVYMLTRGYAIHVNLSVDLDPYKDYNNGIAGCIQIHSN